MDAKYDDPEFWKHRLATAKDMRRAIWDGTDAEWDAMNALHRVELSQQLNPGDSILDAGCGYGALLDLLPSWWRGGYCGIDISPELVERARLMHPDRRFGVCDLRHLHYRGLCEQCGWPHPAGLMLFTGACPSCGCKQWVPFQFDIAVCRMVRSMFQRHLPGEWKWAEMELKRVARRVLILEPEGFHE